MKCDFSYRHYMETLKLFSEDYSIEPIQNFKKIRDNKNYLLLRHDVDFSLDHAIRLAKEEKKHNITSTYFILLHSPFYNALTPENSKIISDISDMGHEIGLHYDTSVMSNKPSIMIEQLKNESKILSAIIGKKVCSVTQHNTSIVGNMVNFIPHEMFLDPMSKEVLKDFFYLSDSVQNWRQDCMCTHVGHRSKIQILTHPIWWNKTPVSRNQLYEDFYQINSKKMGKSINDLKTLHKYYHNEILKKEKLIQN